MNRQASNMRRQWAAVHRCKLASNANAVRSDTPSATNRIKSSKARGDVDVVPLESGLVKLMLQTSLFFTRCVWLAVATMPLLSVPVMGADDVFAPPAAADVRTKALQWVAEQNVSDKQILERVGMEWSIGEVTLTADELFERVIRTLTLANGEARRIVSACQDAGPTVEWPRDVVPLTDSMSDFARQHLRLFVGRYLAQRTLYEEALEVLSAVDPKQVVDPAGYFFQRAICEHQLLKKSDTLKSIGLLLDSTQNVPERYKAVALLMRHDIEQLREASLGEVAKKMSDVERRLKLGRGGEKTQKVEEEIVEALDEIIKKIEQQQQSAGAGGGMGGNQNQSGGAAGDSSVKGATAPGEVDKKDIGNKAGWGSLPPKRATEAKNVINRNFPSHYREAIEQYFKKLANRPAGKE